MPYRFEVVPKPEPEVVLMARELMKTMKVAVINSHGFDVSFDEDGRFVLDHRGNIAPTTRELEALHRDLDRLQYDRSYRALQEMVCDVFAMEIPNIRVTQSPY